MSEYRSPRGISLVCTADVTDRPVLTVENYTKWYALWMITTSGVVVRVDFDQLDEQRYRGDGTAYCDHVPCPIAVQRYADGNGLELDERALEIIVGRWELEVRGRYQLE